jgi:3-hydroxyisobutyrate dehydrogenase-like beta-hydroxyacid dehydrogenase
MARGHGVSEQNTVDLIGLGAMGLPIVDHLARSGPGVTPRVARFTSTSRPHSGA